MTLTLRNVQLDCPPDRFEATVAFWAEVLDATPVGSDGGRYVHLHHARARVEVHLQRLDAGEPRIHLDLAADDVDAEVARLEGLGARLVVRHEPGIVELTDPAGLTLCVVAGQAPPLPLSPDADGPVRLDGLIIDVLADQTDAAARFWPETLGAADTLTTTDDEQWWSTLLGIEPSAGDLTVEIQRVGPGGTAAAPRFHLDVSTGDVPGVAAWLESLGAKRISGAEGSIVLADPSDHLLCVVERQEGGGVP